MKGSKKDNQRMLVRVLAIVLAVLLLVGTVFTTVMSMSSGSSDDYEGHDHAAITSQSASAAVSGNAGSAQAGSAEGGAQAASRYRLALEVLPDEQAVHVSQTLDYTNQTGVDLDRMMFNLYANSLRRQETVPVEETDWIDAFPAGYAAGGVDFVHVRVNGEEAGWAVQGDGELFLRVDCDLMAGESVRFEFEYYLLLPLYNGAMGVGDLTWRLVNFYPVAARYDVEAQDFDLNAYTAMNEPLSADPADYTVTLTLPETWALAAPGTIEAQQTGESVAYTVEAEDIREMALVFSRKMTRRSMVLESGTQLHVLANTPSAAQAMLETAQGALEFFSGWLGEYPYETLTIIESDYLYEGLSHPGLIQVSHALTGADRTDEVVLQVARQYLGGVVGVNRNEEPFLSDALPNYVALMYWEAQGGEAEYLKRLNAQVLAALNVTIPGGVSVESQSDRFTSRMEYEMVIIDRGVAVLHEMRRGLGNEALMDGIALYVQDNWLDHAGFDEFAAALSAVSGRECADYLRTLMKDIEDYVGLGLEWYE